jgi:hypothetical protein
MLQNEHSKKKYPLPRFAQARNDYERRQRRYVLVFSSVEKIIRQAIKEIKEKEQWAMRDSGQSELDAFLAVNEETRDELAYRKLMGQSLNAREELILATLNQQLDQLLAPPPSKEQQNFVAALKEAKRLLAKSK